MNIDHRPGLPTHGLSQVIWEIDTVIERKDTGVVLLTLDERVTRKSHIVKIPSRTAAMLQEDMEKVTALYGNQLWTVFISITSDNSSEFAGLVDALPK